MGNKFEDFVFWRGGYCNIFDWWLLYSELVATVIFSFGGYCHILNWWLFSDFLLVAVIL